MSDPVKNPFGDGPVGGTADPQNPFQIVGGADGQPEAGKASPFEAVNEGPFGQAGQAAPAADAPAEEPKAPEANPFQIAAPDGAPEAGQRSPATPPAEAAAPDGGFEMKGFRAGAAPMNELEAAPLGGAPAGAEAPDAPADPAPPAIDPFAGMDLPQMSPEDEEAASPASSEVSEESDFAGANTQPQPVAKPEPVEEPVARLTPEPKGPEPKPEPEARVEPEPSPEPKREPEPEAREPISKPVTRSREDAPAEPKKPQRVIKTAPSETNQLELRAIFGVDRDLSHQEILRQARSLPGIKNVTSVDAGEVQALETLQDAVSKWGFGDSVEINISCGNGVVDFITAGDTCIAVLINGQYGPGVRETLIIVARTLDRM